MIMKKKAHQEIQSHLDQRFGENRFNVLRINHKERKNGKNRFYLIAVCKHGNQIKQNIQNAKKGATPKSCLKCQRELNFGSQKANLEKARNLAKKGAYKNWANITSIDNDTNFVHFDCIEHETVGHSQLKRNFKLAELPSSCTKCKEISYLKKPHLIDFWDYKLRTGVNEIGKKFYIIDEQLFHPKIKKIPLICVKCNNQQFDVDRTNVGRYASCPKCISKIHSKNGYSRAKSNEQIIKELENLSELVPQNYIFLDKEVKKGKDTLIHIGCLNEGNTYKTFKRNIYTLHEFMCPYSYPNDSLGERIISKFLKSNNYSFQSKKGFPDCKNINELKFDFVVDLNSIKVFIEFDGSQHFKMPKKWGGKDYGKVCYKRDKKKNQFVLNKLKSSLIRIHHSQISEIPEILEREIDLIKQGASIQYSSDLYYKTLYKNHFSKKYINN